MCIRYSIQGPHRDVLLADEQALVAVIGDAAFRLAGDLELARQGGLHAAAAAVEAVLHEGAVLVVGDRMDDPIGLLEQAQAIDVAQRRRRQAEVAEFPTGAVDGEELQGVAVAVAGHGQVDALPTEVEAGAQIDVVQATDAQVLQLPAPVS